MRPTVHFDRAAADGLGRALGYKHGAAVPVYEHLGVVRVGGGDGIAVGEFQHETHIVCGWRELKRFFRALILNGQSRNPRFIRCILMDIITVSGALIDDVKHTLGDCGHVPRADVVVRRIIRPCAVGNAALHEKRRSQQNRMVVIPDSQRKRGVIRGDIINRVLDFLDQRSHGRNDGAGVNHSAGVRKLHIAKSRYKRCFLRFLVERYEHLNRPGVGIGGIRQINIGLIPGNGSGNRGKVYPANDHGSNHRPGKGHVLPAIRYDSANPVRFVIPEKHLAKLHNGRACFQVRGKHVQKLRHHHSPPFFNA